MSNLETNNENHNYTVVMNCNYQSLEIEKCLARTKKTPQLFSKVHLNSFFAIPAQWFGTYSYPINDLILIY